MSDNILLPTGEQTATREIDGVHYQRVLPAVARAGDAPQDVGVAHPLPVTLLGGLPVRRLPVEVAGPGAHPLLPPVNGRAYRVVSAALFTAQAVRVRWASGDQPLTGWLPLCREGGFVWGEAASGWVATAPGQALALQLESGPTATTPQVGGIINYQEVE